MHLFAYGSLMLEPVLLRVTGIARVGSVAATLADYRRGRIRRESFPGIVPAQGGIVPGVLYYDLGEAAWQRLDRFEGFLYERSAVSVSLADGNTLAAQTYVLRPAHTALLSEEPWNQADFAPQWQAWLAARLEE